MVYSMTEAAAKWGVKYRSLQSRLIYDGKTNKDLMGSRKSGKNWLVTTAYMNDRYGVKEEGAESAAWNQQ